MNLTINNEHINCSTLKIYQCNSHHDLAVHHSLLNSPEMEQYDALMIQEPYSIFIDDSHYISTTQQWRLITPSMPLTNEARPPRSVIFINKRLPSSLYSIIPTNSLDITAISFRLPAQANPFTFINIYNPPSLFTSIAPLQTLLATRPELAPDTAFTILGDFNLHHPLWNEPNQDRPIEPEAEELVETLIVLSGTQLKSQTGIPTFHGTQGSLVIDLVFVSAAADKLYEACVTSVNPEDDHSSDHYPILHHISLQLPPLDKPPCYNYKTTDWTVVLDHVSKSLANWEKPHPLRASIDTATSKLTGYIQDALKTHAAIFQPSPFSKRWWSEMLTLLRKESARCRHKAQRTHTVTGNSGRN